MGVPFYRKSGQGIIITQSDGAKTIVRVQDRDAKIVVELAPGASAEREEVAYAREHSVSVAEACKHLAEARISKTLANRQGNRIE